MRFILLFLITLVLVSVAYIRLSAGDPARWHIDPLIAERGKKPNQFFLLPAGGDAESPVFDTDAASLALAFDKMALGKPNVTKFAGDPGELLVTYVQRSRRMRYPDYVSVKFIDLPDDRSTLAVFSRARYGVSDRGVNRARVERWVSAVRQAVAG
ncbi:MAG: DUF1499 domain-containing protein [Rhodobacteraceae bacterium]|nr:DUF1499 domain-containing protein [Paracoccaceae bacterium]